MALKYSVTHNGQTWNSSTNVDSISLTNGSSTSSITTATTKTLNCNGKYMPNNIVIGAKTLKCAGKLMSGGNITITSQVATIIMPAWTNGDINTIKAGLEAYQRGESVNFSAWNIGDKRSFGSVEFMLVHKFTNNDIKTARTDNQADGTAAPRKHPYTIGTTDKLPAYAIMMSKPSLSTRWISWYLSPQKYFSSDINASITNHYNQQDSNLKSILKQFQCYVLNEGGSGGRTGYYQQLTYAAALSCKEVAGSNAYGNENDYQISFDYFTPNPDQRRKIAGGGNWWLRSPAYYSEDNYHFGYVVYTVNESLSGGAYARPYDYYTVENLFGTTWFGCI